MASTSASYAAAALSLEHALPGCFAVVGKPYRRDELARRLRSAIAGWSG